MTDPVREALERLTDKVDALREDVLRIEGDVKRLETNDLPHLESRLTAHIDDAIEKQAEKQKAMLEDVVETSARGLREHFDLRLNQIEKRLAPE